MYKLYTDTQKIFECDVKIQGASLKDSIARIIIENTDYNILFNGQIDSNGKCKVPIKKLKGLLENGDTGNIKLEIIADDTFFIPWQDKFEIDAQKAVTVEVKNSQKPVIKEVISVSNVNNINPIKAPQHINNILRIFSKENINLYNIQKKSDRVQKIIKSYTNIKRINESELPVIISGILEVLSKNKK